MNTRPLVAHIRSVLIEDPGLSAIVSDRIYTWNEAMKREDNMTDTLPEITHIDGSTSLLDPDLDIYRTIYQVSAWASTQAGTRDLADEILNALRRYEGGMIERISFDSMGHSYDQDSQSHGTHITLQVVWKQ